MCGHVALIWETRNAYKIFDGNPEAKRPGWMAWTGFIWLRIGTGGGLLSTR
jgi:hypothetical protein